MPTWAIPLKHLALAFARFGTGHALAPERAKAAARLRAACAAHPWYVGGTGRFCTEVMQRLGARAFVKVGAEGVYCGALPERGLGIAVKCDDGAARAGEVIMAALIARFGALSEQEHVVGGVESDRVGGPEVITRGARKTDEFSLPKSWRLALIRMINDMR